jgi:protein farnesyltransferase subunit beta
MAEKVRIYNFWSAFFSFLFFSTSNGDIFSQLPHLATTYAAVNALVTLGGDKALSSINREKMSCFLRRMKDTSGGFRMHDMGEMDVRACYTAISVASILNIMDDELTQGLGDYILSCQTYEGGIGGEPGSEAHGGYTYCGLAAMILINEVDRLNLDSLMNWAVHRQGVEMGFQGRTNKLVDGCYTFWQVNFLSFRIIIGPTSKFFTVVVFSYFLWVYVKQAAPCVLLQRLYSTNDHDVHGSSHISEGTNEEHHAHDEDDLEDSDDDDDSDEDNDEGIQSNFSTIKSI